MDLFQFTYPYGYIYFNETLVWQPVAFSYSFLILGADFFLIAAVAYFTRRIVEWIPACLITGLSFFSVLLLGPLADVTLPHRAWRVILNAHISSSHLYPGISVMALYGGVFWIITLFLGGITTFLYLRKKSRESLLLKVLFVILIPFALVWCIYPSTLFVTETWVWSWRSWYLLPAMFFVETFISATATLILISRIFNKRLDNFLLFKHSVAAFVMVYLILMQLAFWSLQVRATDFKAIYSLYRLFIVAIVIFLITGSLAKKAASTGKGLTFIGVLALIGVAINKWNIIINGQLISRTGMGTIELNLHSWWILETLSPIALAVLIFTILSTLYPLRGEIHEGAK